MHLQNRARFIASTIFTIFVLAAIIYMTLNLIFGKSSGVSTIAKSLPVMVILVDGGGPGVALLHRLDQAVQATETPAENGRDPDGTETLHGDLPPGARKRLDGTTGAQALQDRGVRLSDRRGVGRYPGKPEAIQGQAVPSGRRLARQHLRHREKVGGRDNKEPREHEQTRGGLLRRTEPAAGDRDGGGNRPGHHTLGEGIGGESGLRPAAERRRRLCGLCTPRVHRARFQDSEMPGGRV